MTDVERYIASLTDAEFKDFVEELEADMIVCSPDYMDLPYLDSALPA